VRKLTNIELGGWYALANDYQGQLTEKTHSLMPLLWGMSEK